MAVHKVLRRLAGKFERAAGFAGAVLNDPTHPVYREVDSEKHVARIWAQGEAYRRVAEALRYEARVAGWAFDREHRKAQKEARRQARHGAEGMRMILRAMEYGVQ